MYVLGIDTSVRHCSVALLDAEKVVASHVLEVARGHAEHLVCMVMSVLDEAGIKASRLSGTGVVTGPGSFSGVRTGLAFARGLAIGTGIPAVGINGLEALARSSAEDKAAPLVAPVVDARRGEVYAGLYGCGGAVYVPAFAAFPGVALDRLAGAVSGLSGDCAQVVLAGNGAGLLSGLPAGWRIRDGGHHIDPVTVARLAVARLAVARTAVARTAAAAPAPPGPLYLRAPDAVRPSGS